MSGKFNCELKVHPRPYPVGFMSTWTTKPWRPSPSFVERGSSVRSTHALLLPDRGRQRGVWQPWAHRKQPAPRLDAL